MNFEMIEDGIFCSAFFLLAIMALKIIWPFITLGAAFLFSKMLPPDSEGDKRKEDIR